MSKKSKQKKKISPDREKLIADGYYDGRYRPKIFKNKKKELKRSRTNDSRE